MNKLFLIIQFLLIITFFKSSIYPDEESAEIDKLKNYSRQGQYQSLIRSGINILDLSYQKLAKNMLILMPSLSNYTIIQTNYNFSFGGEMGNYDYYLQTGKVFSNKIAIIKASFDTSINNLERFDGLFKSFDFITDKGGYKKYTITINTNEVVWLRQNNDAFLLYIFEEKDNEISSGILINMSFSFIKNLDNTENENTISQVIKEFVEKLKSKEIASLLK